MKTLFSILIILLFSFQLSGQTEVVFHEDFKDNSRNWFVGEDEVFKSEIAAGEYYLANNSDTRSKIFWIDCYFDTRKDFYIEAKIRKLSGVNNHDFGIVWNSRDYDYYNRFVLSGNGRYKIVFKKNKRIKEEVPWTARRAINKEDYNLLAVERKGDYVNFYINNEKVYTANSMYAFGSKLGFYVRKDIKFVVDYITVKQDGWTYSREINELEVSEEEKSYKKENLGPNINSPYTDKAPKISPDGKTLYFSRKGHPDNMFNLDRGEIWYSTLQEDGNWGLAKNIGRPLNNASHNFLISVSTDNNTALVGNLYNRDGSSALKPGLSITQWLGSRWSIPRKVVVANYKSFHKQVNYYLSSDKEVLLLAVEDLNTYGELDLYVSFNKNDGFTKPVNLGPSINTSNQEFAPFLASDNKTLYFASRGWPGYGSSDVFVSKRLDDTWTNWSEPKNLGPAINTDQWDAYYSIAASGTHAYLTSSANSLGGHDIFRIKQPEEARPDPVLLVYGKVLDAKTNKGLEATISYNDLNTDAVEGTAKSSAIDGSYQIIMPFGKRYSFLAELPGYYATSENLDVSNITEYAEIERNLYLNPIEVDAVIRLNNVFFNTNEATLQEESFAELNRLVKMLMENPKLKISVNGHTDNVGSDQYNLNLSGNRAASVMAYIVKKGINAARIKSKGFGESAPVVDNDTDENRQLNRRVEFIILSK